MKEIENGLILGGKVYEVLEDKSVIGKTCQLCELRSKCFDFEDTICNLFDDRLDVIYATYLKEVRE